jgi:hypothetical protein
MERPHWIKGAGMNVLFCPDGMTIEDVINDLEYRDPYMHNWPNTIVE